MMKIKIISAIYLTVALMTLVSCGSSHGDTSIPLPEYISELTLDEDNNVTDMGRAGESTPDGNYYYHGSVRLYSDDGDSDTFDCYEGKVGMERGCRGVIYGGTFYNLDRNDYVTIAGTRYRASGLLN